MPLPTKDRWMEIEDGFEKNANFPNCIGALGGKRIHFRPSRKDGAFYHNYKEGNSIILMGLDDANCRLIYVDNGCNGSCNDAGVFLESNLKNIRRGEGYTTKKSGRK